MSVEVLLLLSVTQCDVGFDVSAEIPVRFHLVIIPTDLHQCPLEPLIFLRLTACVNVSALSQDALLQPGR